MSTVTKPVVVGIADKQPSALHVAVREARASGSPLRVVHSAGIPAQAGEFYLGVGAVMLDELRAAGRVVLEGARHVIDEIDSRLDVTYVLSESSPLEALTAEAAGARVLVLGADDVGWIDRLLRTRIAGYLANHAPCPVVVVPEREVRMGGDGEVVVTVDGETSADGPLRMAFMEAYDRDCLLHVLHAAPPGSSVADVEARRANLSEVLAGWREQYPDVEVLEGCVADDVSSVLIRATESADLVIVGRPRHHEIPLVLSRPVAMKVLREARCPVAVVPSDYQGV